MIIVYLGDYGGQARVALIDPNYLKPHTTIVKEIPKSAITPNIKGCNKPFHAVSPEKTWVSLRKVIYPAIPSQGDKAGVKTDKLIVCFLAVRGDGLVRILPPQTIKRLRSGGAKIQAISEELTELLISVEIKPDYVYGEPEKTEEISKWIGELRDSEGVFIQWLYGIGSICHVSERKDGLAAFLYANITLEDVALPSSLCRFDIDCPQINKLSVGCGGQRANSVTIHSLNIGMVIDTLIVGDIDSLSLPNCWIIHEFKRGAFCRDLKLCDFTPITPTVDLRPLYNIKLSRCFAYNGYSNNTYGGGMRYESVRMSAKEINMSFNNGPTFDLIENEDIVEYCFDSFNKVRIKSLNWPGVKEIKHSFVECSGGCKINLEYTKQIVYSCNRSNLRFELPMRFAYMEGVCFENPWDIDYISADCAKALVAFCAVYLSGKNSMSVRAVKEWHISNAPETAPEGFIVKSEMLPNTPVPEIKALSRRSFQEIKTETADLTFLSNVREFPSECFVACEFSKVIFGSNAERVRRNAFIRCANIRAVYFASPDTIIDKGGLGDNPHAIIYSSPGGAVEAFAKSNGHIFRIADNTIMFLDKSEEISEEVSNSAMIASLSGAADNTEDDRAAGVIGKLNVRGICPDLCALYPIVNKVCIALSDELSENIDSMSDYSLTPQGLALNRAKAFMGLLTKYAPVCEEAVEFISQRSIYGTYNLDEYKVCFINFGSDDEKFICIVLQDSCVIHAFTCTKKVCEWFEFTVWNENEPYAILDLYRDLSFNGGTVSVEGHRVNVSNKSNVLFYEASVLADSFMPVFSASKMAYGINLYNGELLSAALNGTTDSNTYSDYVKPPVIMRIIQFRGGGFPNKFVCVGTYDTTIKAAVNYKPVDKYDTRIGIDLKFIRKLCPKPYTDKIDITFEEFNAGAVSSGLFIRTSSRNDCEPVFPKNAKASYHSWRFIDGGSFTVVKLKFDKAAYVYAEKNGVYKHYCSIIQASCFMEKLIELSEISPNEDTVVSIYNYKWYRLENISLSALDFVKIRLLDSENDCETDSFIGVCRYSAKVCIGVSYEESISVLGWFSSLANATKVAESCGYNVYNPKALLSGSVSPLNRDIIHYTAEIFTLRNAHPFAEARNLVREGYSSDYIPDTDKRSCRLFELMCKQPKEI